MAPTFPQLKGEYLEQFSVCGRIEDSSGELTAWLAENSEEKDDPAVGFECRYKVGGKSLWILALANPISSKEKEYVHLHIGCAKEESFSESKRKRGANDTREKVEGLLERFLGQTFESFLLISRFKISSSELPNRGLIDLLLGAETKVSGTPLIVTGGTAKFSDRSTPWRKIEWSADDDDEDLVEVTIEGFRKNLRLSKGMLIEHEKLLNVGFARYVLEEGGEEDNE